METRLNMKRNVVLSLSFILSSSLAFAQLALPPGASPQSTQDPGYKELIAACKVPPPAPAARGGGPGGRAGGAPAAAAPTTFPPPPAEYTVSEIPGVIAAGQKWTKIWETSGNNADGILADKNGDLLIAQNHNAAVVKLDKSHKVSVVYKDTHTGGALSMNKKGELFIVERGLRANVTRLAPKREILADKLPNGDPLDCIGGVINDLTADSKGGVYFTMGGVYYADPKGVVTKYGTTTPNGIVLSADEKTLYATNGPAMAAFDVQPDGSLTNQREFAKLASGGDGSTIDKDGRVYVTTNAGVEVLGPDGKNLGVIPTPRGVITAAFGGKDKKTLYILARGATQADGTEVANAAQVWAIQMIAQGYKGRAK